MVEKMPDDIRQKIIADIPIGRMGRPDEVAFAVEFLASDEAALFTGANLSCNGGQHMM
jgi:acetoacetyl-CoA reductase